MSAARHGELVALLSRRQVLARAGAVGLGAVIAGAVPVARAAPAASMPPDLLDATLQAFADAMVPGRRVAVTESGAPIDPQAIAGVDPLPGAVEADALALFHNADVGFDALQPAFVADLTARSLLQGDMFLSLPFASRVAVCLGGLDFGNPTYLVWEAASAVPFTAFCAAALVPEATWNDAVGYRVMGLPGTAPNGYTDFSWGVPLSRERTSNGSLP